MSKNKEHNETYFNACFKIPNPGLRSYFGRVVKGNAEEYRTKFYDGRSVTDIVSEWLSTLEQIAEQWPGLWTFENDLAKKVGPMSIMKPLSERMEDIDSYYDSILKKSEPIYCSAVSATSREWSSVSSLKLRSQRETVDNMKLSTNSGSPYFTKRSAVVNDTLPALAWVSGDDVIQQCHNDQWNAAAVLGWRGQEGGPNPDDVKQRVVWMFPFSVNIRELQLYQPAIELAQQGNIVPAWVSMDAVDAEITKLFDTKATDDLVVCTDFTKFDQHFNRDMQNAAKACISKISDHDEAVEKWLRDVFPIKYVIPLAYNYGYIRKGAHGMGSGSGGTNFDETLAHRCLQYEAAIRNGAKLNPHSMCLGDDGILTYPGITVEQVTDSYSRHGQDMNVDKQSASPTECTYLRRWHHINYRLNDVCVGVYSTCRAIGRLCEQERYYDPSVWGPKMVALRQLSILENVKYHPLKELFVQFCIKGDAYRLGIDIPGFLDDIESIAAEATTQIPDFLGYTRSMQSEPGIGSWWIVNYLKSLA